MRRVGGGEDGCGATTEEDLRDTEAGVLDDCTDSGLGGGMEDCGAVVEGVSGPGDSER